MNRTDFGGTVLPSYDKNPGPNFIDVTALLKSFQAGLICLPPQARSL